MNPELKRYIELYGEDRGRELFREDKIRMFKVVCAQHNMEIRTGSEILLDLLVDERRELNQ